MGRSLGEDRRADARQADPLRDARRALLMASDPMPPSAVLARLRAGVVIPAHPLALTSRRALDERRQRALTRYYLAAGAGRGAGGGPPPPVAIRPARLLRAGRELAAG